MQNVIIPFTSLSEDRRLQTFILTSVYKLSNFHEVLGIHLAGRQGRAADPESTRFEGALVSWTRVLVQNNPHSLEHKLAACSVKAQRSKVDQDEMCVRSTCRLTETLYQYFFPMEQPII